MPLVCCEGLGRQYPSPEGLVRALHPLNLTISADEFVMIVGPSGSGKTTLLNLLAGLDKSSEGRLTVDGMDLGAQDDDGLVEYRRSKVGIVFQFFNLLPNLTALENVELIADLVGRPRQSRKALELVGLGQRGHHFPHQLSGGEQQRVAIARALVKEPALLLADEPTGNLDAATGRSVLARLQDIHRQGSCIVLVTHNIAMTPAATRVITLSDGHLLSDLRNPHPISADQLSW